jgi:hypothetical protein
MMQRGKRCCLMEVEIMAFFSKKYLLLSTFMLVNGFKQQFDSSI